MMVVVMNSMIDTLGHRLFHRSSGVHIFNWPMGARRVQEGVLEKVMIVPKCIELLEECSEHLGWRHWFQ